MEYSEVYSNWILNRIVECIEADREFNGDECTDGALSLIDELVENPNDEDSLITIIEEAFKIGMETLAKDGHS